ncbi:MAG TPA: hypothetical protein VET66_03455 [Steroidobacteraceae bacterium]|nr:hypothetical protein [Steroidobacteraceae bacterium]
MAALLLCAALALTLALVAAIASLVELLPARMRSMGSSRPRLRRAIAPRGDGDRRA